MLIPRTTKSINSMFEDIQINPNPTTYIVLLIYSHPCAGLRDCWNLPVLGWKRVPLATDGSHI